MVNASQALRRSYDELCAEVSFDDLLGANGHAIARIEPSAPTTPSPAVDLLGVVDPEPRVRPKSKAIPENWWGRGFDSPPVYLASLREVTCYGGRVSARQRDHHTGGNTLLVEGRYVVPDSYFVRDGTQTLPREILRAGPKQDSFEVVGEGPAQRREGVHLLLGGAHGHFGHFLTEGLSRLWAWPLADEEALTVVVYQPELARWQWDLLAGLGIGPERVLCLEEPMVFERLLVPSIAYHLHRSVNPRMNVPWGEISERYADGPAAKRHYVSRSRFTKRRALVEEQRIEEVFEARGFEVVHPQHMSVAQQVAMAASSDVLAGSAGSGMYLGAFQRPGTTKLILSPRAFTLVDDVLISHAREGTLAYLITDDILNPDAAPRYQDYRVDPEVLAGQLDRLLA